MTFTKEFFPYYQSPEFGHFYNCKLYTLFDNYNIVGKFTISHEVAFISTIDTKFKIDIKNNIFKSSEYIITDIKTKTKIGLYIFSAWKMGLKEIGSLTLNNESYVCNRQKPDIQEKTFKKSTWGQYKLLLANHLNEIVYTIKVQTGLLEFGNSRFKNAQGEVKSNAADIALILTGLFFFERLLDINDETA